MYIPSSRSWQIPQEGGAAPDLPQDDAAGLDQTLHDRGLADGGRRFEMQPVCGGEDGKQSPDEAGQPTGGLGRRRRRQVVQQPRQRTGRRRHQCVAVDASPHRQLNEAALANLSAWVPALGLYRCRRTKLGFEAVPMWRPSTTDRPPEKRHLNLKIVPAGIRDFGADQGYTPLDLSLIHI